MNAASLGRPPARSSLSFLPGLAGVLLLLPSGLRASAIAPEPLMPAIQFTPEAVDGMGKWYINAPTIPGWHYQLEQLSADGLSWTPAVFWYGNGQPLRHFVTDGPLPASGGLYPPPPAGTPTWQLRLIQFRLELPANGAAGSVRLSRAGSQYPGNPPVPVAAWDHYLTGETLPAMVAGSRWFLFQSWEDRTNRILWHTEFQVTAYASASSVPANSLAVTPQQAGELTVWQNIKNQLTGAMTAPQAPPQPPPPSTRKLLRLRRTSIDTNSNGIPDWWELANGWKPFALSGQTGYFDPAGDADLDGLSNLAEFRAGTDYLLADTDGDGAPDSRDTDPSDSSRHPVIFDTLWHGMGGWFVSGNNPGQTGWASRNWGSPRDFTPAISGWTTPAIARQQLVASVNWPAGDDFSQAQKLPDMPQVAEFRWDRYSAYDGRYDSSAQVYERKIRARRDTAQSWEQRHTLLRLVLPVTADYQREFSVGAITSYEKTDLVIPASQTVSPALELRIPASDSLWNTGTGNLHRRHYFTELHRIPDAVPVNSGFDEGIIDSATGFAKPDSSDFNLKADRDIPWRGVKAGDLMTAGLHQGWFGIRPDAFKVDQNVFPGEPVPGSFYDGASIKIRKLARTDSDTGAPESGQIRFWITQGDGESAGAWPIDPYDRSNASYPATELVGWVYGPNATVPAPSARVRYWIEGLTPGKCTLEFKCIRGPHTITHEQTFLVATRKTKPQWQEEVHHQIRLQKRVAANGNLDLDFSQYEPSKGFFEIGGYGKVPNHWYIREIYYYYRQLYKQLPEKFLWAGMAKVAGAPVYAGMSEIQLWKDAQEDLTAMTILYNTYYQSGYTLNTGTEKFMDEFLVTGNKQIFGDMGWAHLAYQQSGIWALEFVEDSAPTPQDALLLGDFEAWRQIDNGIRTNSISPLRFGNRNLLRREQERVMQQYYNFVKNLYLRPPPLKFEWMDIFLGSVRVQPNAAGLVNAGEWLSANSIRNPIPGGPPFRDGFPARRLDNLDERWAWIENSANGMLERWLGTSTAGPNLSAADRASRVNMRMYDSALPFANTALGLPEEP